MGTTPLKIEKLAKQIKSGEAKAQRAIHQQILKEQQEFEAKLLEEFKIGFSEQLPLLEEAKITFSAHQNDARYSHKGSHILFKLNKSELRMDFTNRRSYRYEHKTEGGTMTYGEWNKEKFILFIYDNLLKKAK